MQTSGTIVEWRVADGEHVAPGDVFCEVETDKATVEFESQENCVIGYLLAKQGHEIPVGTPILATVESQEELATFQVRTR